MHDDGYRTWTFRYDEVGTAARRLAARLHAAGLVKGDAVVLWGENRPEWIVAFWACLLRGIVVVPIDYRSAPSLVDRIAAVVSARLLLIGEDVDASTVTLDVPSLAPDDAAARGARNSSRRRRDTPPVTITTDDTAEIIFTSGATAEPKGRHHHAPQRARQHRADRARNGEIPALHRPVLADRFCGRPPLSHMFGQAMATSFRAPHAGLHCGVHAQPRASRHRPVPPTLALLFAVLVSVPKILDVLREHLRFEFPETRRLQPAADADEAPLPKEKWYRRWWRFRRVHRAFGLKFWSAVVGAAPLDPALEEFWGGVGFLAVQGYGLTETAPIVTLNHPLHARARGRSASRSTAWT